MTRPSGESLYLRLVQKPLDGLELRALAPPRRPRRASARPAASRASGLFARLIDAGFTTSLLLRGSVPGGTAAAAQIKYARGRERRSTLRLPRPRGARGRLDLPPVPLLLLHERLPLHVLRRQRPRGRLGAGLHLPRGRTRTGRGRSGSRPPRTTTPATSCAAAGTTRRSSRMATTRSSTQAPDRTPRTSSAASTSPRCPSPPSGAWAASSTCSASSGATRSGSPIRATCARALRERAQRPLRRLRPWRRQGHRARSGR